MNSLSSEFSMYNEKNSYVNALSLIENASKEQRTILFNTEGKVSYAGRLRQIWETFKGFCGGVNRLNKAEVEVHFIRLLEYGAASERKWIEVDKAEQVIKEFYGYDYQNTHKELHHLISFLKQNTMSRKEASQSLEDNRFSKEYRSNHEDEFKTGFLHHLFSQMNSKQQRDFSSNTLLSTHKWTSINSSREQAPSSRLESVSPKEQDIEDFNLGSRIDITKTTIEPLQDDQFNKDDQFNPIDPEINLQINNTEKIIEKSGTPNYWKIAAVFTTLLIGSAFISLKDTKIETRASPADSSSNISSKHNWRWVDTKEVAEKNDFVHQDSPQFAPEQIISASQNSANQDPYRYRNVNKEQSDKISVVSDDIEDEKLKKNPVNSFNSSKQKETDWFKHGMISAIGIALVYLISNRDNKRAENTNFGYNSTNSASSLENSVFQGYLNEDPQVILSSLQNLLSRLESAFKDKSVESIVSGIGSIQSFFDMYNMQNRLGFESDQKKLAILYLQIINTAEVADQVLEKLSKSSSRRHLLHLTKVIAIHAEDSATTTLFNSIIPLVRFIFVKISKHSFETKPFTYFPKILQCLFQRCGSDRELSDYIIGTVLPMFQSNPSSYSILLSALYSTANNLKDNKMIEELELFVKSDPEIQEGDPGLLVNLTARYAFRELDAFNSPYSDLKIENKESLILKAIIDLETKKIDETEAEIASLTNLYEQIDKNEDAQEELAKSIIELMSSNLLSVPHYSEVSKNLIEEKSLRFKGALFLLEKIISNVNEKQREHLFRALQEKPELDAFSLMLLNHMFEVNSKAAAELIKVSKDYSLSASFPHKDQKDQKFPDKMLLSIKNFYTQNPSLLDESILDSLRSGNAKSKEVSTLLEPILIGTSQNKTSPKKDDASSNRLI